MIKIVPFFYTKICIRKLGLIHTSQKSKKPIHRREYKIPLFSLGPHPSLLPRENIFSKKCDHKQCSLLHCLSSSGSETRQLKDKDKDKDKWINWQRQKVCLQTMASSSLSFQIDLREGGNVSWSLFDISICPNGSKWSGWSQSHNLKNSRKLERHQQKF